MLTALITGANRGIGLALTRALIERGHSVFAGARQPESAEALRALANDQPDHVRVVRLDVTDAAGVLKAAADVKRSTRTLDVLVNNAAVLLEPVEAPFSELDPEWFDTSFAVNVSGAVRVTQAFLPLLLNSSSPRIMNISSGAGSIADRTQAHYYCYGASKAALNHWTVGLANELRTQNTIVVAVSPGWVRTDMGGHDANLSVEESAGALARTIESLSLRQSGRFLDRFGKEGDYSW